MANKNSRNDQMENTKQSVQGTGNQQKSQMKMRQHSSKNSKINTPGQGPVAGSTGTRDQRTGNA